MTKQYAAPAVSAGEYDVIVAGGGPAGIAAAVAAARRGMKTLLAEGTGALGGTGTSGALPFWLGCKTGSIPFLKMLEKGLQYRDLPRKHDAVRGIFREAMERIKAEHGGVGPAAVAQTDRYPALDRLGCHDEFIFDIETGKRVLEQMVSEAGAEILYFTTVLAADCEGSRINGVFLVNKDGLTYASCRVLIDCTGDADVVARAGFETYKGDRKTGLMCTASLVAHIENVDSAQVADYLDDGGDPWFRGQCRTAFGGETGGDSVTSIIMFPMVQEGVFMINGGMGFNLVDGTSARDVSSLMQKGRRRAEMLLEKLFRPYVPGFAHARLRLTASYPGIRETRRIVGEYTLTEEDLLGGHRFDDVVAFAGRHFDLTKPVKDPNGGYRFVQPFHDRNLSVPGGVTPIPYGTLLPKGAENVAVAGRCIAADGQAMGPVRIMSACFATGQAAGTAASIAVKEKVRMKDVGTDKLRKILREAGAVVDYRDVGLG